MAPALAIHEESESLQSFDCFHTDTMGILAMRQFKRADGRWLFQGLRE
jgi:hypothetical protein